MTDPAKIWRLFSTNTQPWKHFEVWYQFISRRLWLISLHKPTALNLYMRGELIKVGPFFFPNVFASFTFKDGCADRKYSGLPTFKGRPLCDNQRMKLNWKNITFPSRQISLFWSVMHVVSHRVARGWKIKETLQSTRSDDFTYPPIDDGRDTSWWSSTLSVVILLSLPMLCGRVFSRFVERWRSLNEIQPSTSSGSSVILFLHASKYINCFRLPIS